MEEISKRIKYYVLSVHLQKGKLEGVLITLIGEYGIGHKCQPVH